MEIDTVSTVMEKKKCHKRTRENACLETIQEDIVMEDLEMKTKMSMM